MLLTGISHPVYNGFRRCFYVALKGDVSTEWSTNQLIRYLYYWRNWNRSTLIRLNLIETIVCMTKHYMLCKISWCYRSPDLCCDFFLWNHHKAKYGAYRSSSIAVLKRIFNKKSVEILQRHWSIESAHNCGVFKNVLLHFSHKIIQEVLFLNTQIENCCLTSDYYLMPKSKVASVIQELTTI